MSEAPSTLDWSKAWPLGMKPSVQPPRSTPWLDDGLLPGHGHSVGIHAAAHARHHERPVRQAAHVVFARVGDQHRLADGLARPARRPPRPRNSVARAGRNRRRETAMCTVTFDGSRPSACGHGIAIRRLHLRAQLQVAAVGAHIGQAVERLHGRMREIGQLVFHVEALRGAAQARRARRRAVAATAPGCIAADAGTRCAAPSVEKLLVRPLVPLDLPAPRGRASRPRCWWHTRRRPQGISLTSTTPGNGARRACRPASQSFAPIDRRPRDDRKQHARHAHVDAELRAAIHLHRRIEPLLRLAEVAEVRRILERDFLRAPAASRPRPPARRSSAISQPLNTLPSSVRSVGRIHASSAAPRRPAAWRAPGRRPRAAACTWCWCSCCRR